MTITSNKRIAKNTFFLYFRMILVMGITLYTSRIVLQALGQEDYGIFSVVGGTITFFTFISNSMAQALQRFLSYAIGENNAIKLSNYFNQGFWAFILISTVSVILCESGGLLIFFYYLDIPSDKQQVAFWVFQLSILNLIVNLLRVPYNGLVIAFERMNFFALLGILEVILKLGVAFAIFFDKGNRLFDYMILLLFATIICNLFTVIYCRKHFSVCKINGNINKTTIYELLSFSGWTLLTSGANVLSNQGVVIVLNNLFGVLISAATGIANQVMSAFTTFLGSFQTAFNPQIVKSYASGDYQSFNKLLFRMSLFSFYLMMIVSLPLIIKMDEIMSIWLSTVPKWTAPFSICIILMYMIESYSGPFWMGMQAVGRIKKYQIIISSLISLNFILAFIILYCGASPLWAYLVKVLVSLFVLCGRVLLLHKYVSFSRMSYFKDVILRSITCCILSFIVLYYLSSFFHNIMGIVTFIIIALIISGIIILTIGFSQSDRSHIINLITSKIYKNGSI